MDIMKLTTWARRCISKDIIVDSSIYWPDEYYRLYIPNRKMTGKQIKKLKKKFESQKGLITPNCAHILKNT